MLYREAVWLVTRLDHPVLALDSPTLADLALFPWVLPLEGAAVRADIEAAFFRAAAALPWDFVECGSAQTLRALVLASEAVAPLPQLLARQDPQLAVLSTTLPSVETAVAVLLSTTREPSPTVQAMLRQLRAVAPELDGAYRPAAPLPVTSPG